MVFVVFGVGLLCVSFGIYMIVLMILGGLCIVGVLIVLWINCGLLCVVV